MNTRNQYIIMGVLVIAMLVCSLYIWDHDRKLPKEEEYIYEPFKSEDVDFWIKGGGNILGPPEDPIDYYYYLELYNAEHGPDNSY